MIPLLSAGTVFGSFDQISIPRTASGPTYSLETTGTGVQLRVVATNLSTAFYRAGIINVSAPVTPGHLTADADGDGLPNLLEYAMGLPISSASEAGVQVDSTVPRFTFPRDTGVADVILVVEATSNLAGPWNEAARFTPDGGWSGSAQVTEVGSGRVVTARVAESNPGNHRFYRLRVIVQGPLAP